VPVRSMFIASVVLTGLTAAVLCGPPLHPLHSFKALLLLATGYLLLSAAAHLAAFFSVFRFGAEGRRVLHLRPMMKAAAGAWMAIAWMPLLAVLTSENSFWIAFTLPVAVVWATLFLTLQQAGSGEASEADLPQAGSPFRVALEGEAPLWRTLLPAVGVALAVEAGTAFFAGQHSWLAGVLFAAAAAYLVGRLLRARTESAGLQRRMVAGLSGGNTTVVWMLLVLALAPFLVGVSVALRDFVGVQTAQAAGRHSAPSTGFSKGSDYSGVILLAPPKPHAFVSPTHANAEPGMSKPRVIPFDGAYWYFKEPDTHPRASAHIAHGDPVKNQIRSTDYEPLIMEAHQGLIRPLDVSCCRVMKLDVLNGDANPGQIKVELLLRWKTEHARAQVTLGEQVLASSTVKPMPLNRAPVHDSLTFQIPRAIQGKSIDEITVRLKPERMRSLAGAKVSVEDFALQP
jgi:hypothetical protein